MPWTIYRYILKDMFKLMAVSSAVLVLLISFAAATKPLSEGLLGHEALVKYVMCLAPTMLGFILPFSSAFASTLVFNRMVNDNELLVCRAGGISYRMILLPVLFMGLVSTLSLFYLGNWVVPSFYRRAAVMLEKDMMQVIVSKVGQMRPVMLGDMVLYADAVDDSQPPPLIPGQRVQPTKLIRLRGVAVGELDQQGRLRSDSTAEKADVLLYRVNAQTWATVNLENVVYYDALRGNLFFTEQWAMPQLLLPSPLKDDPRFLSWPQMRHLRSEPEVYDEIRHRKQQLAQTIAAEVLMRQIQSLLSGQSVGQHGVTLLNPSGTEQYRLTAPLVERGVEHGALGGGKMQLLAQGAVPVRVEYQRHDAQTRRIEAQRAVLWIEPGDPQPEPWIRVELEDARVYDLGLEDYGTEHPTMLLPRHHWPTAVLEPYARLSSGQLSELARRDYPSVAAISQSASVMRQLVVHLFRRIEAQLNERAALAVACLLMMVLGAVLSMKIGGGMPLVTYFWSFMLAIVVVIISHSGENLAAHPEVNRITGLSVIWLGNLLLVAVTGGMYLRLARN